MDTNNEMLEHFKSEYTFEMYKAKLRKKRIWAIKNKYKSRGKSLDKASDRYNDRILSMLDSKDEKDIAKLHEMYNEYCLVRIGEKSSFSYKDKKKAERRYTDALLKAYSVSAGDIRYVLEEAVRLYINELTMDMLSFITMEEISRSLDKLEMNNAVIYYLNENVKKEYGDFSNYIIKLKFGFESVERFIFEYIRSKATNRYINDNVIDDEQKLEIVSLRLAKAIRRIRENLILFASEEFGRSRLYRQYRKQYQEYEVRSVMLLKDSIPDHMCDMYPLAREMKRHFVLHVGPTNSGKTYESIEKLKRCKKGIYLAPLRLLAYEIYDKMNDAGVKCNMLTGEEAIEIQEANHLSCTIEMLDEYEEYELAVIDEGQNVGDVQRGGAWTKAILGVRANEVHICSDDSCVDLVTKMIMQCNDTYEIVYHERMTELSLDKSFTRFPEDVKDRDALIVFSKKSVMAVAADLQKRGISASVLYGNLPYDVRLNEVRRFTSGETKVVIATDAIGMGVNLPIKRVVFLETKKFDGISIRKLYPTEIKQIAGRAGRRGLYKTGLYTAEFGKHFIDDAMKESLPKVTRARVNFPESLVDIDMSLSELLRKWFDIPDEDIYVKSILEDDLKLCQELEIFISDKHLIYRCITIAFDSRNRRLHDLFIKLASAQNLEYDMCKEEIRNIVENYSIIFEEDMDKLSLDELGEQYSVYDLLYAFLRKFEHNEYLNIIMDLKRDCSKKMMLILQTEEIVGKVCPDCGASLKWNYPYRQCQKCFEKKHYP